MKSKRWVRSFFEDKNGHITVWQWPNFPLAAWFVLMVAAYFVSSGHLKNGLQLLSSAFLLIWAFWEITSGSSNFRRLLGFVVILDIILSHFFQ